MRQSSNVTTPRSVESDNYPALLGGTRSPVSRQAVVPYGSTEVVAAAAGVDPTLNGMRNTFVFCSLRLPCCCPNHATRPATEQTSWLVS